MTQYNTRLYSPVVTLLSLPANTTAVVVVKSQPRVAPSFVYGTMAKPRHRRGLCVIDCPLMAGWRTLWSAMISTQSEAIRMRLGFTRYQGYFTVITDAVCLRKDTVRGSCPIFLNVEQNTENHNLVPRRLPPPPPRPKRISATSCSSSWTTQAARSASYIRYHRAIFIACVAHD